MQKAAGHIEVSRKGRFRDTKMGVSQAVAHNPEVGGSNPSPATIKNLETITVSRFFLCLSYPLLYPLRYSKPNCGYRKYRGFTRFTSSRKMTAWFLNAQTNLTQHEPEAVFSASGSSFTLCCFLNNYIVHLNVQIATEREQIVYARHITST